MDGTSQEPAALEAVRDLVEQTLTEDFMVETAKKQGIRLASQAAQQAPDYLKGLLSWRDQIKKGRLTIYLDTSAVDRQVEELRSVTATVIVGLLVGAAMIASSVRHLSSASMAHISSPGSPKQPS